MRLPKGQGHAVLFCRFDGDCEAPGFELSDGAGPSFGGRAVAVAVPPDLYRRDLAGVSGERASIPRSRCHGDAAVPQALHRQTDLP
jgi:hypothetical protein